MASRASTNGQGLIKAPITRDEFISFVVGQLELQPHCSILDLDNPSTWQLTVLPRADLGIWLDTWHDLVSALGTNEDAEVGIIRAKELLGKASDEVDHFVFSSDFSKPPLDQYQREAKLLFERSTGLEAKELATY